MNNIKFYPDIDLTKSNSEIIEVTEDILVLGEDLLRIVIEVNGFGLSAPQIGKNVRAVVVRDPTSEKEVVHFALNPKIIDIDTKLEDSYEGCLSFPGLFVNIKRYPDIIVEFMNVKEEKITLPCSGLLSFIFQHEIDHLDGILLINKMSNTAKKRNKGYFKQLELLHKKTLKKLKKQTLTETIA